MRGVKTPVFMRFLEAEKQGLQYPDHQFKSGCRLSNPLIFQGIFSYVPSMALTGASPVTGIYRQV